MDKQKKIAQLEERNSELAKEILLNEAAVYETEKELAAIPPQLMLSEKNKMQVALLKLLIEKIETKNNVYRQEIFENDLEIKRLQL